LTFGYTFSTAKYPAGAALSIVFNSVSKQDLELNIILARRALEQMHQVTHLVSLSIFLNYLFKIM
jgi:hypothetical protein